MNPSPQIKLGGDAPVTVPPTVSSVPVPSLVPFLPVPLLVPASALALPLDPSAWHAPIPDQPRTHSPGPVFHDPIHFPICPGFAPGPGPVRPGSTPRSHLSWPLFPVRSLPGPVFHGPIPYIPGPVFHGPIHCLICSGSAPGPGTVRPGPTPRSHLSCPFFRSRPSPLYPLVLSYPIPGPVCPGPATRFRSYPSPVCPGSVWSSYNPGSVTRLSQFYTHTHTHTHTHHLVCPTYIPGPWFLPVPFPGPVCPCPIPRSRLSRSHSRSLISWSQCSVPFCIRYMYFSPF